MKKHLIDRTTPGPSTAIFFQVSLSKKQRSCFSFLCHELLFFGQQFKGFLLRKGLLTVIFQTFFPIHSHHLQNSVHPYMILISIQSYKFLGSKKTVCLPFKVYPNASQEHFTNTVDWFSNHNRGSKIQIYVSFIIYQSISKALNRNFSGTSPSTWCQEKYRKYVRHCPFLRMTKIG